MSQFIVVVTFIDAQIFSTYALSSFLIEDREHCMQSSFPAGDNEVLMNPCDALKKNPALVDKEKVDFYTYVV